MRESTDNARGALSAAVTRRFLGLTLLLGAPLLLAVPSACTFYTGCPDQPANPGSGNTGTGGTPGAGGKNGGGGSGNTTVGGEGGAEGGEGRNWQDAAGSLEGRAAGCGVVYISHHPTRDELIAGIDQFGLWSNTDGSTWQSLGSDGNSAIISNGVTDIVYDPEDPDVYWEAGIYIGPGGYRTDDGGKTFVQLGDLKHVDSISIDFTDPKRQTLIAGPHEKSQLIFKSTDGGKTWAELTNLPEKLGFSNNVLLIDAQTYLVGCNTGIIRTTDGGKTWQVVSQFGGSGRPLQAADGSIYWNADGGQGMVRSSDGGESFERIVGGGVISSANPPLQLPDGRLATLQGDHVVLSDDEGFSWKVLEGTIPQVVKGFMYMPTRKGFYISTDSCNMPIPGNAIMKLDFDYESE